MNPLSEKIRARAVELAGDDDVTDKLLSIVGDAQFALIGEASHGTHQFYKNRAEITKKLLTEKGFTGIAVEADFPDAYRVNRYVRCEGGDRSADAALSDFKRYPLWMWRNTEVRDFVEWLREFNSGRPAGERVGFYGMDLYSLHSSMEAVLEYLDSVDPAAAKRARYRYSCFEHFGEDPQRYGYAASYDMESSCEQQVIAQLTEMRDRAAELMRRDGFVARDEYFFAEQNARLVKNAEEYYRQMFRGRVSSWNLRDNHMTETLFALRDHLQKDGRPPKVAVWAHNSHLGDARATDMGARGEWNVGQLVRERCDGDAVLIGYTTYTGSVTATTEWDQAAQLKRVRPALEGSYEILFHQTELPCFMLDLSGSQMKELLARPRLERAIGVIYRPETERLSHYFDAYLAMQFDAVIHFDHTRALEPMDRVASWSHEDAPETFPAGM